MDVIIGAIVGVSTGYLAFKTQKINAEKEVSIALINSGQTLLAELQEEKKKWGIKEEELKNLLFECSKDWSEATKLIKTQELKIKELETRIAYLEENELKFKEKELEWGEKEKELISKIYQK